MHLIKKSKVAANPTRSNSSGAAGKKGHHMAHTSKAVTKAATKKRHNPFKKKYEELRKRKSNRSSRNPSIGEMFGRPGDLLTTGLSALASAAATKQLPQMILADGNAGWQGYAASAAVTAGATWAAGTFLGAKAAQGALAGGLAIILDRALTENFSQLGPYLKLSGVGDPTAAGKLGTIRDGYYFHPGLVDSNGRMITPQPVIDDALKAVLAAYPNVAAPIVQLVQQSGGAHLAGTPSNQAGHAGNTMMLSHRFSNRFGR